MTSRFLLVATDPDLDRSRQEGIFCAIKLLPGVELVCDLEMISPDTLELILLDSIHQAVTARKADQPRLL
jgi:hypothetical protein